VKGWLAASGAKTALICGTGLALDWRPEEAQSFEQVAGLNLPTTVSHKGQIETGQAAGAPLIQVRGRLHAYETGSTAAMWPLYSLLAEAGVTRVIISGAVGSLDPDLPPGALAQINDHLFFGGASPLVGKPHAFIEMAGAYQPWPGALPKATYAWTHGPHLETAAEIRALKAMGAHVVGMSMAPEVSMARYLGLEVFGLAAAVNWATGQGPASSLQEMLGHAADASKKLPQVLEPILSAG